MRKSISFLASFVALTAGSLAFSAGCAADSEEDTGEQTGALDESICNPRADAVKRAHLAACGGSAGLADELRCVQSAKAPYDTFMTELRALETTFDADLKRIVDDCVARAGACPADPAIAALQEAGVKPADELTKSCETAINQVRATCTDQIDSSLRADNANHPYLAKKAQKGAKWRQMMASAIGCIVLDTEAEKCVNAADGVRETAFRACRDEAPTAEVGTKGCRPIEGKHRDVLFSSIPACGEIKNVGVINKGVECVKTNACKQYIDADLDLKETAREYNLQRVLCDDGVSYKAAQITYARDGKPTGVELVCKRLSAGN